MESPQRVIVPLGRIVKIPAVSGIVALHHIHVFLQPGFVHRHPILQETDVHQDPEKPPVVLRHVIAVDLVQPVVQVPLLPVVQRLPEIIRREAQPAADHRHLHHPLVEIADFTPILRVGGIRPVDQSLLPQRPELFRFRALSRQHGHQRPQRAAPAFHAGNVLPVMGGSVSHIDARLPRRHASGHRPQDLHCGLYQVLPCTQESLCLPHSLCLPA